MNKLTSLLIVGAGALSLGVSSALAHHSAEWNAKQSQPHCEKSCSKTPEPLGVDLTFGYATDYIFRGNDQGEDLVSIGLDYSSALTEDINYNLGAWYASFDGPANDVELDLYASLDWELFGLGWEAGVVFYNYPDADANLDDEHDLFFAGSTTIKGIDVSVKFINYSASGSQEVQILEYGAGSSVTVLDTVIDLGLTFGTDVSDSGQTDYLDVTASTDYAVGTGTLTPFISYVNGDNAAGQSEVDDLIGGASFTVTF